ncbi:MAG: BatA domain-containing protein [Planctomycetaceae bacterium]
MSAVAVLAFGFASPFRLWGLLLAGIPLLIQWLHRRKYAQRVWAAMRFLRAATESQTRRLRRESLLLLCVRTAILVLAALALAEPVLELSGWLWETTDATHTLLLLDTSLSMQASHEGLIVGEHARDAARKIVESGQSGDSYQLVTIAGDPQVVIRQPSFSVDAVLAEIDRLDLTETFGNVPEALVRVERLLAESPVAGPRRVVVVSDFQQSNWRLEEPAAQERTRGAWTSIARQATVSFVPLGAADIGNLSVQDAHVESPLISAGMPETITIQVRNHGQEPRRAQRLQLLEGGRVLQSQTIDVPPFAEISAVFVTHWSEPGEHALQIRLEDDTLPADNERWLTVSVKEKLSVLLVNGRAAEGTLGGATDFVALALQPPLTADAEGAARLRPSWVIQPSVIDEAELMRTDLSRFDCIFVCDVPFLSSDEVLRLTAFVKAGGGLIIGMGDQVQLDEYSRLLGGEGDGLMPVQLVRVVGNDGTDAEPFRFADPEAGHPLTRAFAGNPRAGLTTANISRYVEMRIPKDSTARTALAFSHGAPAIIEHTLGAGRVLLVTTSLDDRWGSWALWPSFLPMMHEFVEYVTRGQAAEQTLVGQPLRVPWPDLELLGPTATLRRPDGRTSTLRPTDADQNVEIVIDDTSQRGIYALTSVPAGDRVALFAVNIDPRESDLQTVQDDEWQAAIPEGIPVELAGSTAAAPAARPGTDQAGMDSWLLVAVLVLLLVEQVMAWNGRYGLVALLVSPAVVAGPALLPSASVYLLAGGLVLTTAWRWNRSRTSRGPAAG